MGLLVQTIARDGNCLFRGLSMLLDDSQYKSLRRKAAQEGSLVSEDQLIQIPTINAGQVDTKKKKSVPCILKHCITR
jgi:hypothetical protein